VNRPVEGPAQGMHRSPHFGSSVEFAEYREYTPGDPPSRIDWAVFARSDRYMVRRFQEETNLRAYVLLDTSESLAFKDYGAMSKMEYASHLAAGLMFMLISQGDTVGLMTFDSAVRRQYEPVGSMEGLRHLLLALEEITAAGQSNIEAVIHEAAQQIHSRSLVIIISDLLQQPAEVVRGLRHLHHDKHAIMVVHVMDSAEIRLSYAGMAEFRELETGAKMVVEIDDVRNAYAQEVQRYIEEIRTGCASCLATHHLIDTRSPLEESLFMRLARA
jgi:uncharacterized protein (DUF58 family)